ncbi:MAG: DUF2971 domain-containing protein [Rubrivivax sp.]|nr:DUF2971 domain-containing protein [Rubrivivax sp.]
MYTTSFDEFISANGFSRPFPSNLYHYTSTDAAINILANGEFWLAHPKYFNDRQEYHDGVGIILSVLSSRASELGPALLEALKQVFLGQQHLNKPLNVGVLCFSGGKRDLLSQWRGYTKANLGICLSVNTATLYSQNIEASLRRCIYSPTEKIEIVNKLVDDLLREYKGKSVAEVSAKAFWHFQQAALIFKSEAFDEEQEWRLITFTLANNDQRWNFRSVNSTIIPYVKVKIDLKPCLDEVIVGPSENQELTRNSLFFLMFKHEIWRNNITASSIPYRSL